MSVEMPRVLVVDDSALMRKRLATLMESTGQLHVCGFAHDGNDAVAKVLELKPDVVTLDVEMPGKNGLEAIPAILDAVPVPIIMVSGLTQEGAQTTLDALNQGAVDFISKPTSISPDYLRQLQAELVSKIKAVAGQRVQVPKFRRRLLSSTALPRPRQPNPPATYRLQSSAAIHRPDRANTMMSSLPSESRPAVHPPCKRSSKT